ncbi:hypothetical protein FOCC_FOCC009491 [Frankliniella occidentalis]|nr:hypothetical protein FOCC_FOCC009491 [Frankliniella occidentalis]
MACKSYGQFQSRLHLLYYGLVYFKTVEELVEVRDVMTRSKLQLLLWTSGPSGLKDSKELVEVRDVMTRSKLQLLLWTSGPSGLKDSKFTADTAKSTGLSMKHFSNLIQDYFFVKAQPNDCFNCEGKGKAREDQGRPGKTMEDHGRPAETKVSESNDSSEKSKALSCQAQSRHMPLHKLT